MLAAQGRERSRIVSEFGQIKGLMPLLMKHRNGEQWTHSDRLLLRQQLCALTHMFPYLTILALPGSFLLLPILAWWLDRRRSRRDDDVEIAT
ncbi:MAG: hypothetical protein M0P39_02725 [Rhodocyclaceae bacterium]|jgi:hypothetical protein|nr:hypothetical protein [Rhodocyclaceae bacterium]